MTQPIRVGIGFDIHRLVDLSAVARPVRHSPQGDGGRAKAGPAVLLSRAHPGEPRAEARGDVPYRAVSPLRAG
jgi:hypothetical protein